MLKNRDSNIELLKIVVMFMFVLFHVSNTIGNFHPYVNIANSFFFDSKMATNNIQYFIIIVIYKYLGGIGNNIFLITSIWFLLDSKKFKLKKIIHIILDVWVISVLWLLVVKGLGINITLNQVIRSILPITMGAYWYITCYLLLYLIHPMLNIVVEKLTKKELLEYNLIFVLLYCMIGMLGDFFYFTRFVRFIVLYLIIAYLKKYVITMMNNRKINKVILAICILLTLCLSIGTNVLGLNIHLFQDKVLLFAKGNNPIIILIAITTFNLCRTQKKIKSSFINKWGCLSLYIYMIHENFLFGTYLRPYVFVFIKDKLGYSLISLWVFLFAVVLFIISSVISFLYSLSIKKIIDIFSCKIENCINNIRDNIVNRIMKIN